MDLKQIPKEDLLAELERRNKEFTIQKDKGKKESEKEFAEKLKKFEKDNAAELQLLKSQWITVSLEGSAECKIKIWLYLFGSEDLSFEVVIDESSNGESFIFSGSNSKIMNEAFGRSYDAHQLYLDSFPKVAQKEFKKKAKELEKKIAPLFKKIVKLFEGQETYLLEGYIEDKIDE